MHRISALAALLLSSGCATIWSFPDQPVASQRSSTVPLESPTMPLPVQPTGPLSELDMLSDSAAASKTTALVESFREPEPLDTAPRNPLEIEVAQAFLEEEDLRVKVRLSALTDLDPEVVVVELLGLQEGEVLQDELQQLSLHIPTKEFAEGETAILDFRIPSRGLTEYQIRGSWGENARKVLEADRRQKQQVGAINKETKHIASESEAVPPEKVAPEGPLELAPPVPNPVAVLSSDESNTAASQQESLPQANFSDARARLKIDGAAAVSGFRRLSLENVQLAAEIAACGQPPCPMLYTIKAELVNHQPEAVADIALAVGLYWTNEGQLPSVPEFGAAATANEEVIALNELTLHPGERKRVRIAVDRMVPQVPGGEFIPHLRILRYLPLLPEPEIKRTIVD